MRTNSICFRIIAAFRLPCGKVFEEEILQWKRDIFSKLDLLGSLLGLYSSYNSFGFRRRSVLPRRRVLNLLSISESILKTYSVLFCGGDVVNRSEQASCQVLTRVGSFWTGYLSSGFSWTCKLNFN